MSGDKMIQPKSRTTVTVSRDDPYLVVLKAELLHAMPELTGAQINAAAMLAVIVMKRLGAANNAKL